MAEKTKLDRMAEKTKLDRMAEKRKKLSDLQNGDGGPEVKKSRLLPEEPPEEKEPAPKAEKSLVTDSGRDAPSEQPEDDSSKGDNSSTPAPTTEDTIDMSWGYDDATGPATWAKNFPAAAGERQSPVDLSSSQAVYDASLGPLTINYQEEKDLELENPGLSFKANIAADSVISGGPLGSTKYKLVQFHFHWGHDENSGSEHTVDGKMYPSELHLVHYNTEKYANFGEAVTESDGLAVLGVFIKIGDKENEGFQALSSNADKVKCKGKKCGTGAKFNPASLLPENTSEYWTYEGSLTTPPCCESVRWIVLKNEISISSSQIQAMRDLCCDDCGASKIPANYRPPLPLGSRKLLASFK